MERIVYNTNETLGNLIFLSDIEGTRPRKAWFRCKRCNKEFITDISRAKAKDVVSCGCYRKENSSKMHTIHGNAKSGIMTPEYVSWQRMIQRCINKKCDSYPLYGGRGIKVCERWRYSFHNFLTDMGEKPFKKAQIDRINVNGDYEPSNCRWVSCKENNRNKKNNFFITWMDQRKSLSEWSEILGINKNTLRDRIYSKNWTLEEAMTIKVFKKGQTRKRNENI